MSTFFLCCSLCWLYINIKDVCESLQGIWKVAEAPSTWDPDACLDHIHPTLCPPPPTDQGSPHWTLLRARNTPYGVRPWELGVWSHQNNITKFLIHVFHILTRNNCFLILMPDTCYKNVLECNFDLPNSVKEAQE